MTEISPQATSPEKSAYLIGIGGVGMSALAGLLSAAAAGFASEASFFA